MKLLGRVLWGVFKLVVMFATVGSMARLTPAPVSSEDFEPRIPVDPADLEAEEAALRARLAALGEPGTIPGESLRAQLEGELCVLAWVSGR